MIQQREVQEDIVAIRKMMAQSTRFLMLSGTGVAIAGLLALIASFTAWKVFGFYPQTLHEDNFEINEYMPVAFMAVGLLVAACTTVIVLSRSRATKHNENFWTVSTRRLVQNMFVPIIAGGVLMLLLFQQGYVGLLLPLSLIFNGLALFNAGAASYAELKWMGILQIILGLVGLLLIEYSLSIWATGFGVLLLVFGIYLYIKYEK